MLDVRYGPFHDFHPKIRTRESLYSLVACQRLCPSFIPSLKRSSDELRSSVALRKIWRQISRGRCGVKGSAICVQYRRRHGLGECSSPFQFLLKSWSMSDSDKSSSGSLITISRLCVTFKNYICMSGASDSNVDKHMYTREEPATASGNQIPTSNLTTYLGSSLTFNESLTEHH